MDGQQRLTSLYIGLKGSYASKLPYRRHLDTSAYPNKHLYLDLLSHPEDDQLAYNFEFLTDAEATENNEHHWFPIGKMLDLKEQHEVNEYLLDAEILNNPEVDKEKAKFASKTLYLLHKVLHVNQSISYYLEQNTELDKVLNIFIRVNSGGTTLSYSDLLLSFATAQWKERDAREEINGFVDEVNAIGSGFNINKDIVLKACLVLCDMKDVSFKVDNFSKTNMLAIESEWDTITQAFRGAVTLVSSFGFNRDNITSNNLFIPIAYYLKKIGLPKNFEVSITKAADRALIKRWFVSSLLKRVFSFNPDGVLIPIRDIINNQDLSAGLPLDAVIDRFKGTNRTLQFTDDDFNSVLYFKYGGQNTLPVLSILCPWADLRNKFHVDHIFPHAKFTKPYLRKAGVPEENIERFIKQRDFIGNLQLLEGVQNQEKSDTDFVDWLSRLPADHVENFKEKHFIPVGGLTFVDFENFLAEREQMLIERLRKEL